MTRTRFLFLSVFLFPTICKAEITGSTATINIFHLNINYPVPASGITFQTVYTGILDVSGGYERVLYKKISVGIGADYSHFQTNAHVLDIKTNMNIFSPSFLFGYQTAAFKKILIHPLLNVGYAFIRYSWADAEGNTKPTFNEQGAFIQPSLFVAYLFSKKISVGLNGSFEIIFQHFGSNATLEDSNIRIACMGIGMTYSL